MAEQRLIDAEALKTKFEKLKKETDTLRDALYLDGVLAVIDTAPTIEVVPKELYEQILWERNIAMEQLEEHGIGFASKKE